MNAASGEWARKAAAPQSPAHGFIGRRQEGIEGR